MESDPGPGGSNTCWRSYDADTKAFYTGFGHVSMYQPGSYGCGSLETNTSPVYGKFSPSCPQEEKYWSFDTQYPLDIGDQQEEGAGGRQDQPNSAEKIMAPPNSPEYFSSTVLRTAIAPFNPSTPNFAAAAHQAVVDLFPEIANTCIFRDVKPTLSELETQDTSSITQIYPAAEPHETYRSLPFSNPRSSKRKRTSDMCSRRNETPSPTPLVPIESLDLEDPQERDKKSIPPPANKSQPFFPPTYAVGAYGPLKSGYQSQLSSDLVNLDLKNSGFSHVFGIPEEAPNPSITISPRHLSKLQIPSTPPPQSVFDPELPERYNNFSKTAPDQDFIGTCSYSDETSMSDNDVLSPSPTSTPTSFISRALPDSKELLKEQNRLLLRWRSEGISYRTIKKKLGINEAESTLRGRLRTLTKPKNERLRKPQWTEEDIELLLEIVDPSVLGVKWKQVSDTIVSLGGSYRFGPSTCKKQYLKLVEEGRASPLLGCGTVVGKRSRIEFESRGLSRRNE